MEILIYFLLWYQLFFTFCFDENLYYVCLILCLFLPAKPWNSTKHFSRILKDLAILCYKNLKAGYGRSRAQITYLFYLFRRRVYERKEKQRHPERVPNCFYL